MSWDWLETLVVCWPFFVLDALAFGAVLRFSLSLAVAAAFALDFLPPFLPRFFTSPSEELGASDLGASAVAAFFFFFGTWASSSFRFFSWHFKRVARFEDIVLELTMLCFLHFLSDLLFFPLAVLPLPVLPLPLPFFLFCFWPFPLPFPLPFCSLSVDLTLNCWRRVIAECPGTSGSTLKGSPKKHICEREVLQICEYKPLSSKS